MYKLLLIIIIFLFCLSCGIKDDPEYKSKDDYRKTLHIV